MKKSFCGRGEGERTRIKLQTNQFSPTAPTQAIAHPHRDPIRPAFWQDLSKTWANQYDFILIRGNCTPYVNGAWDSAAEFD